MSNVGIHILREMIRADLELAFEHLENDSLELAERELRNALQRLQEIKEVRDAAVLIDGRPGSGQTLLTLNTTNDQQPNGADTAFDCRET